MPIIRGLATAFLSLRIASYMLPLNPAPFGMLDSPVSLVLSSELAPLLEGPWELGVETPSAWAASPSTPLLWLFSVESAAGVWELSFRLPAMVDPVAEKRVVVTCRLSTSMLSPFPGVRVPASEVSSTSSSSSMRCSAAMSTVTPSSPLWVSRSFSASITL